jgi:indolepyruvate ferredoxin oxidoreductase beta subunit
MAEQIIKLAIMAVGGQGGGVLANWIDLLARAAGYACQATSVAGVAQRTGATIYYLEMAQDPAVFSLAPAAGDVDIVIAAELMEAGRAVMRGFVTPDRTTLIASSHRALAVSEKTVPGDGTAKSAEVRAGAELAAKKLLLADFEQLAVQNGSVISASLFGALAGAGCLPFARGAFEQAIREGGKGVEPSLRAFAAAYDVVQGRGPAQAVTPHKVTKAAPAGPEKLMQEWGALERTVESLPQQVQDMARAGLRKVVDFQDVAYGRLYLDQLDRVLSHDAAARGYVLSCEAAKYIANAMAYDDLIKVADLKTRATRWQRINHEMGLKADQEILLTEYFHPRAEEVFGLLPVALGARLEQNPRWQYRLKCWFSKGRRLCSNRLAGFLMLYLLGGCRKWRLNTLRHAREQEHMRSWLEAGLAVVEADYDLAVELIRCRRLIKGYSDTHARGLSKYDKVTAASSLLAGRKDAAEWICRLREAALQDGDGMALEGALATVRSFARER